VLRADGETENINTVLKMMETEANANGINLIDLVASIYEQFKGAKGKAIDKVRNAVKIVNTSVHLYPWHYIGGAATLGFLVCLLFRH
jgi:ElaB/YqjD/DUF883 family membrane-anchored ribosome-binding protein